MLKDFLGEPDELLGVGLIYPVKIKDYALFNKLSVLFLEKGLKYIRDIFKEPKSTYLLDFLVRMCILDDDLDISYLEKLFSITLNKKVVFKIERYITENRYETEDDLRKALDKSEYYFEIETSKKKQKISNRINKYNFEDYKSIISRQNLVFEIPSSPSKKGQKMFDEKLESMSSGGISSDIESMICAIVTYKGMKIDDIKDYTIYQLKTEFEMITRQFIFMGQSNMFAQGRKEVVHLSEKMMITESPYKDFLTVFTPTKMEEDAMKNQGKI